LNGKAWSSQNQEEPAMQRKWLCQMLASQK
jgi:hypothetical protein